MKKGIFSIDGIIAILLIIFMLIWMQLFISGRFDEANAFGIKYEAKSEAIKFGSIANAFYASNPGKNDYYEITHSEARAFKDPSASFSSSIQLSYLKAELYSRFGKSESNYSVADGVSIDSGRFKA